METTPEPQEQPTAPPPERLAYSIQEAADLLGVNYFSVLPPGPASQTQSVPSAARQASRVAHRTVEAADNRMRTMSNPFEYCRPTQLEDKAHAEAVWHFAEHLKQFPANGGTAGAGRGHNRFGGKHGRSQAGVSPSYKPMTAHTGTRVLISWQTSTFATGSSPTGRNMRW